MRYLLFREDDCPGCGGDGWRLADDDACPICDGLGWIYTEVAIVQPAEAERIIAYYRESIPFQGEAMPNREVNTKDCYGL